MIYHYVGTIFARQGSSLYVSVKFPSLPFRQPLELFRVKSFPIPVNDSTNHATQLLDIPDYFAITHDVQYYTYFQSEQLLTCQSNKLKQCTFQKVLTSAVQTSCLLALFMENKAVVKQLCNFRFLTNHVTSDVVLLSKTSILVYNVDVLELDCKSGRKMKKGCKFCTVDVPCECSVLTPTSFLPVRLTECHKNTSEKLHPVNLALLQNFFEDDLLENIGSNSLFKSPLQVDVPKFTIYNHSISQVLANDNKAHLNLQKMAKSAKENSMIFSTLTESLLSGDISLKDSASFKDILLYVTTAVAGFCLVAFIFMALRLRKVLIILSVLKTAHNVHSSTVPSFIYKTPAPVEDSQEYFWGQINFELEHWTLIFCIMSFLLLIVILINTCKQFRDSSQLIIEITNGKESAQIVLKSLILCPTYWKIVIPQCIERITVAGLIAPHVKLEWDEFRVTNKISNQELHIDNLYRVSPLTGRKIRRIMSTTYCAYFFFQHHKLYIPLQNW